MLNKHSKKIIRFYNEFADKYDETIFKDRDYSAYEKIPSWLLAALPASSIKICDLGCGTGLGSKAFIKAGHQVTGIDISSKMLEKAHSLGFKKLICQSLEEPLPFPNEEFDVAQLIGVMEFIQHPQALFKEIARILKPEGIFGLTIPKKLPSVTEKELEILSYYPVDIEKMLQLEGFQIKKKEDFQGFIYKEVIISYVGYLVKKSTCFKNI